MKTITRFVFALTLALGCDRSSKDREAIAEHHASPSIESRPSKPGKLGETTPETSIGASRTATKVWPIPSSAVRIAPGTWTQILAPGSGHNLSQPGVAMVLSFIRYDKSGHVESRTPVHLLALEHTIPPWQDIYRSMKPNEVRRVWITDRQSETSIYDVELTGFLDVRGH